jgi:serine/threonine protein phosphatase PrpC
MPVLDTEAQLGLLAAALSDVGRIRQNNEDAFLCEPQLGVFAVADGMGGHQGGEVAAQMAVAGLRRAIADAPLPAYRADPSLQNRRQLLAFLSKAVDTINGDINGRGRAVSELRGMGCTLSVMLVCGHGLFLAQVGDSRIYGLLGATLYQLTDDHTFGEEMLRRGGLTPAEVQASPNRDLLMRALGVFPKVEVDTLYLEVSPGDTFLLCSDGVHRTVGTDLIERALGDGTAQAAQTLIQAALDAGGADNATAVVVKVESCPSIRPIRVGSEETLQAMAGASIFVGFSKGELLRVQKIATGRIVEAGTDVVLENHPCAELFLVLEGTLAVSVNGIQVGALGPGDPFGELSLHPTVSLTMVRAESRARLLVFPLEEVRSLLASDTALTAKLAMNCLERVWQRLHELAHLKSHLLRTAAESR